jgi:hypothetical protein
VGASEEFGVAVLFAAAFGVPAKPRKGAGADRLDAALRMFFTFASISISSITIIGVVTSACEVDIFSQLYTHQKKK